MASTVAQASPTGRAEASLLEELSVAQGARYQTFITRSPAFGSVAETRRVAPTLLERRALEPLAAAAAQQHGVSIDFFKRLIRQESGYNPNAVSIAGAQGIAQFMPATAAQVGLDDPFDPAKALPKSAEHLADLQRRLGNEGLAAAAYNAGEGRVRAWLSGRSGLPLETQNYVRSITGRFAHEWAPSGLAAIPIAASAFPQTGGAPKLPVFARAQSAEWRLGVKLMGVQNRLTALLDAAGEASRPRSRSPRQPRATAASSAMTGEKALCASMGGCIVAAVY
ncbi:lytic transglycosylase [Methylorubrum populi]|uniref:Lytic transglycosylase n=2 Tax=Methylobacterium radiotolerans TaxID=31998 RepID=A0ABU7TGK6_9HYPH